MSRWKTNPRWQDQQVPWLSEATERADHLVHEHPWASAGTIFALGVVIGCAVGLSLIPAEPPRTRAAWFKRPADWSRRHAGAWF